MQEINILYIHGMGGGGSSRIPAILAEHLPQAAPEGVSVRVTVRTYDFEPSKAEAQIAAWVEELRPTLIVGESLGSIHAIAIKGHPHILVSPSLNAPLYLDILSAISIIPGVTSLCGKIWKPKEGDRQELIFDRVHLRRWKEYRAKALANSPLRGSEDAFFAFFGTRDHYRRSGTVSLRTWIKYFGKGTFTVYEGTHFMEEEYILSLLIPKILEWSCRGRP